MIYISFLHIFSPRHISFFFHPLLLTLLVDGGEVRVCVCVVVVGHAAKRAPEAGAGLGRGHVARCDGITTPSG